MWLNQSYVAVNVTLHLELLEKCPLSGLERCSRKSVSDSEIAGVR